LDKDVAANAQGHATLLLSQILTLDLPQSRQFCGSEPFQFSKL